MEIVIDKSYLQGASAKTVRRLCEEHTGGSSGVRFHKSTKRSHAQPPVTADRASLTLGRPLNQTVRHTT